MPVREKSRRRSLKRMSRKMGGLRRGGEFVKSTDGVERLDDKILKWAEAVDEEKPNALAVLKGDKDAILALPDLPEGDIHKKVLEDLKALLKVGGRRTPRARRGKKDGRKSRR